MRTNILGYICLFLLLLACQEDEQILSDNRVSSEGVKVTIPIGIAPETEWDYATDYVPMQTRATGERLALVDRLFKSIVMKEIDGAWYVDTIQKRNLENVELIKSYCLLTQRNDIGKIDIVLSPGHYKILVVIGPNSVSWNLDLKKGFLIKAGNESDENIPYACTYRTNEDYPFLSREVFAGVMDFTVSKTGDLHSSAQNGNNELTLKRWVSKYRVALEGPDDGKSFSKDVFPNTQHFVSFTLTTDEPHAFCEGIDCFGKAFYSSQPKKEIKMRMSADRFRFSNESPQKYYQIITPNNSTHPSQYLFIDPEKKEGIPYHINSFKLHGASDGSKYNMDDEFPPQMLYPNSITGITLKTKGDGIYIMTLCPDRDPAKIFSPTVEIDNID